MYSGIKNGNDMRMTIWPSTEAEYGASDRIHTYLSWRGYHHQAYRHSAATPPFVERCWWWGGAVRVGIIKQYIMWTGHKNGLIEKCPVRFLVLSCSATGPFNQKSIFRFSSAHTNSDPFANYYYYREATGTSSKAEAMVSFSDSRPLIFLPRRPVRLFTKRMNIIV